MIYAQLRDLKRGSSTRLRGNSATVSEYALQATEYGTFFISFSSAGFDYPKVCQPENI